MRTEFRNRSNVRRLLVVTLPFALFSGQSVGLTAAASSKEPERVTGITPSTPESTSSRTGARVYHREYFDRFSPATAHDILQQIPSFTPREASLDRGLGQASENVLINARRASDKSGGAITRLRQISAAQVQRVEIIDAAELNIPGLSGPVANFVVEIREGRGRYEWSPEFFERYADNNLFRGSVSYTGTRDNLTYTLSLVNNAVRTGFGGGTYTITDWEGNLVEDRWQHYKYASDAPTLRGDFEYEHQSGATTNLLVERRQMYTSLEQTEQRSIVDGPNVHRQVGQDSDPSHTGLQLGHERRALGGNVKLILVANSSSQPVEMEEFSQADDSMLRLGTRFLRSASTSERILRSEYERWFDQTAFTMSVERAENRLKQAGELYLLDQDGVFVPVDYPAASGGVTEIRHEVMVGASRQFSPVLTGQASLGAEHSRLDRALGDTPASQFFRPKGSVSLTWNNGEGRSLTGTISRRVGQISFFDYLSQPNFREERERAGNPDLVPPQSWEFDLSYALALHSAVSLQGRFYYRKIEDLVDIIPIGESGSGVGNVPSAISMGGDVTATIDMSGMGIPGGRLDARYMLGRSSLNDPVTGEKRPISGSLYRSAQLSFRQDFENDWAWGFSASYNRTHPIWYVNQIVHGYEGPEAVNVFAERTNIGPLTVRVTFLNATRGNRHFNRWLYNGPRSGSEVARIESQKSNFDLGIGVSFTGAF